MIETPTVFILGAGASKPYGYPTGKELRKEIITTFQGRYGIFDFKTLDEPSRFTYSAENALQFTRAFKDYSTQSIDLFLARNTKYIEIGKLAIILSIFKAEADSTFRENIKEKDQDWYSYIFHRMTSCLINPDDFKRFGDNNVTFITFNYDRSLEHFLFESLRNSFSASTDTEIVDQLKRIPIYHIHGKIDDLPWENSKGSNYSPAGSDPYGTHLPFLQQRAGNIKIVHEQQQRDLSDIYVAIQSAEKIFSLGFGYAQENLEVLKFSRCIKNDQQIFGTGFGLLGKEIGDVKKMICTTSSGFNPILMSNINIKATDCVTLLREYL